MYIPTRPNTSNSKSRNTRLHEPCTRRAKKKPAHLARLRAGIYTHHGFFPFPFSLLLSSSTVSPSVYTTYIRWQSSRAQKILSCSARREKRSRGAAAAAARKRPLERAAIFGTVRRNTWARKLHLSRDRSIPAYI